VRREWLLVACLIVGCEQPPPPPGTVVFETFPPGAKVYRHFGGSGVKGLHNTGTAIADRAYIGLSDAPIPFDLGAYSGRRIDLTVDYELEGHVTVTENVGQDLLKYRRWPRTGVTNLPPVGLFVTLRDFVVGHRFWLLGLGALLALSGAAAWRWRRRATRVQTELAELALLQTTYDASDPYLNKEVGRYLLTQRLGSGGMAVVYKGLPAGQRHQAREAVAIKVIAPSAEDAEFIPRFQREVRLCQKLSHPNIVRLIEWSTGEPMYLALELIEGGTLRDRMGSEPMEIPETIDFLYAMVAAVAYAHSLGVIHRDLKPENVMLTRRGQIKVMDFGLARNVEVSQQLTVSGAALGTPSYMAPEQINGETLPSADQYALGIIAFEMLTGRRPFEGDVMTILFKHMSSDAPPIAEFRPGLPVGLQTLVMRMIARKPDQRFASLTAVSLELEKLYPRLAEWRMQSHDPFRAEVFEN
jgi:hypothetical protein